MRAFFLLPALLLVGCGCPDLAVQAMVVTYGAGVDASRITLDATDVATGEMVLSAADPDEASGLEAGSYDIAFYLDGAAAATLDDVCTEGAMTGCEAEDWSAEGGITPSVVIEASGDTITATLEANGTCP